MSSAPTTPTPVNTVAFIRARAEAIGNQLNQLNVVQKLLPHIFSDKPFNIPSVTVRNVASYLDHTCLKPQASWQDIDTLCKEAHQYRFAAVCVNPYRVPQALRSLRGSGVACAAVVGFPLGANSTGVKVEETEQLVKAGVLEIDMVANVGALIDGDYGKVLRDISSVVSVAGPRVQVKVILECCLLTPSQIVDACVLSVLGGAHFVKTSTGFSTGGAKVEDVRLMKLAVGNSCEVKASGGVRDYKTACQMIQAGATRIGTSNSLQIVREEMQGPSASNSKSSSSSKSSVSAPLVSKY